ncbi:MAG: cytochrome c biogenesis protein CcsA [Campylobacterota bacterium]|nr:cytochrome c biogenesis protein CcsA [Campylobacterota bacterium]
MKKILSVLMSMQTMVVMLLLLGVASGYATFIENDFGTMTAKAEIYNARWFELLLAFLTANLIYNIIRFKMIQRKKALVLLFHVSFIVIMLGAAVTRYVGFEGTMHIREGATKSEMTSTDNYLMFEFIADNQHLSYEEGVIFSNLTKPTFDKQIEVNGKSVEITMIDYIPNSAYQMVEDPNGKPMANMMVTGASGAERIQLSQGEFFEAVDLVLDFESGQTFSKPVVSMFVEDGKLFMDHPMDLKYLKMDDQTDGLLSVNEKELFVNRTLFTAGSTNFVLREFYEKASQKLVSNPGRKSTSPDAIKYMFTIDGENKESIVFGSAGRIGKKSEVRVGGMTIRASYGAKILKLPFALKLEDFELERYPGSMSPASYASDVVLIDKDENINMPYRIYMNHVLDHKGYRFFQSSYDQDERGTVLSVNNDPGTPITYVGYLMLVLGMFGSLFTSGGRFRKLTKIANDAAHSKEALASLMLMAGLLFAAAPEAAAEVNPIIKEVKAFDKAHAEKFGQLVIQDSSGRMKPMDTLSTEIMHKLNRSGKILGLSANQAVLGMMMRPDAWREIKLIKTSDKKVNKLIGIGEKEKTAAFSQFFEYPDEVGGYKLGTYVEEASRKRPADRDKFDKAVLKVDERVNVAYMVYTGDLMRMWPKSDDPGNKWFATVQALQTFDPQSSEAIRQIAVEYFTAVDHGVKEGDWRDADLAMDKIAAYQKEHGAAVYVEQGRIKAEIWYNHADIFERLWPLYFLVGFVLLFLSFLKILKPKFKLDIFSKVTLWLLILFFLAHTVGLGLRWYISGHAPWSNGYESMIYIAWASVLAGFIFSKNSPITLAATGILTGLILFVAHLNWMDPQVTNLVPVLASYWLSIHVSVITGSYGFLGLSALLGFIVLILFVIKGENNEKHISLSIKELNSINEMSLMIGLAMLTVGNFLGGVWANESWGRYWGWDPKETWTLVSITIYAALVHLRFIKSFYSPFLFATFALLSFSSILMTYFGVNYYLAGMHSYAKGDPVPVPDFVPITYGIIFVIIALAWRKRKLA